ncbi:hypothetical protein VTK73DRAFT_318 [Phialemonium thermophilum]|uniref:Zn(2)-C6 fungal-type domain-containing protein n=1 Tax=Phialemonium thermophilum TaxID=223376 RepID=A0ABR3VVS0_9PEZI
MDSDESNNMMFPNSPSWNDELQACTSSAQAPPTMAISRNGQLSPVSTGMDGPRSFADGSSNCSMGHSCSVPTPPVIRSGLTSAEPDSWAIDYYADGDLSQHQGRGQSSSAEFLWDACSDDLLAVPKLEPLDDDDDFHLDNVTEAPMATIPDAGESSVMPPKLKRPRGRPRKHPLAPVTPANKVTKGRSKTGCLTCRKRKKKCDEAKPRCMNCEKNAVVCEGYPEKQIWKSGKERAEEERIKSRNLPSITMQPIFHGLETTEDFVFWKHYNEHLSTVLTVEGEHKNAFKDMIVPIAVHHQGLMHSILSLASKHIDYETPQGRKLLQSHPAATLESLHKRSIHHHEKAMERLYADLNGEHDKSSPEYRAILSARYGQMLCLLLESMVDGNATGDHRVHLQAYRNLIRHSPPEDPAFMTFITEYFHYHIFADELVHIADDEDHLSSLANRLPTLSIRSPRLLGVADGLFVLLSQITAIRQSVRKNMASHIDPVVNYASLYQAAEIEAAIRNWTPRWPAGDNRDRVGLLYKQMMWIYLFRTINPPTPSSKGYPSSSAPLSFPMSSMSMPVGCATIVNTPPPSDSASCSSSPRVHASSDSDSSPSSVSDPPSNVPLPKMSSVGALPADGPSQQEKRDSPQDCDQDARITIAIEESLAILESFKHSDPVQTLLLIPCLVIGTACFSPSHQERIRIAVRTVRGYTGMRNADRLGELLEEVWRLLDSGDWAAVWDWQSVARDMRLDFLCA